MRAPSQALSRRIGVVIAATALVVSTSILPATATDPRLEEAVDRRTEIQARLDELLQHLGQLDSESDRIRAELDALREESRHQRDLASAATATSAARWRAAYAAGTVDPVAWMLAADDPLQAVERAQVLGILARVSRGSAETATAAKIRTNAVAARTRTLLEELEARSAEAAKAKAEVAELLAEAEREEASVRATIAAEEEAARRRAAARAEAQRVQAASRSAAAPSSVPVASEAATAASAPGGIACPIGTPRSYSDTYGAPRSGGRAHEGTDILAPYGTAIYAYESGTIARLNNSGLGGISIYLDGDSGNLYYYTHLSGYVSGLGVGQRVSAGQHIAFNGDSGNASGIPHLHFEVMPGGGSSVNPYPYVLQACG